jgi:hypothetical protein
MLYFAIAGVCAVLLVVLLVVRSKQKKQAGQ